MSERAPDRLEAEERLAFERYDLNTENGPDDEWPADCQDDEEAPAA